MDNKQLFLLVLFVLIQNISKVSLARRDKTSIVNPDDTKTVDNLKKHRRNDIDEDISDEDISDEYFSEEYNDSGDAPDIKIDFRPSYTPNKSSRKPNKNKPGNPSKKKTGKPNTKPKTGKKHKRDGINEDTETPEESVVTFIPKQNKNKPRKGKKHRRDDNDEDISNEGSVDLTFNIPDYKPNKPGKNNKPKRGKKKHRRDDTDEGTPEENEVLVDNPEDEEVPVDNPEDEVLVDIPDIASYEIPDFGLEKIPDIGSVEIPDIGSVETPGDAMDPPDETEVANEIPINLSGEAANTPNKTLIPPKDIDDENLFRGNAFEGFDERKIEFIKENFSKHNKEIPRDLEEMIKAAEQPKEIDGEETMEAMNTDGDIEKQSEDANNQPIEETDSSNDNDENNEEDENVEKTDPILIQSRASSIETSFVPIPMEIIYD